MMRLLASVLAFVSAPALAESVVVSDFDFSYLPMIEHRGYDHLGTKAKVRLQQIAEEGTCRLPGQGFRRLDFEMAFAAEFEPNGKLKRIVLQKINCPEAEAIVGGALVEMINKGDYRPTGENPDGWYRGRLGFGMVG